MVRYGCMPSSGDLKTSITLEKIDEVMEQTQNIKIKEFCDIASNYIVYITEREINLKLIT